MKESKNKNIALVLAAGQGSRMGTSQKKQYLLLDGKPMLYYSLHAFEQSEYITDIIIVVGAGEETYVEKEIVVPYGFQKVRGIVAGGKERYHSVALGIKAIETYIPDLLLGKEETICGGAVAKKEPGQDIIIERGEENHVWVHDGARPYINEGILERAYHMVKETKACVVAMPVKDTIKIADETGNITSTPNRNFVWQIQTPQVFDYQLIKKAYEKLIHEEDSLSQRGITVTDDAMVVETFTESKVRLVKGDYRNIKITTPEDLQIAEVFRKSIS